MRSLTAQRWSVSVNSWSRQSRILAELGTAKLKYRNWPEIRVRVRVKPELKVWLLVDGRGGGSIRLPSRPRPLGFPVSSEMRCAVANTPTPTDDTVANFGEIRVKV